MSETPDKVPADSEPSAVSESSKESESVSTPPASAAAEPSAAVRPAADAKKTKKEKKPKKPGRWRRRLIVAIVTIVVLALTFRILLSILLPWTLRRVAREYGLDCTYERSDIYLASGDVGLWHVHISQLDDGKPVADADYCRADISPLELFRGRLVVQRLETDGAELTVERSADGTIPLLKRLLTSKSSAPKPTSNKPMTIDFSPPVAIDALRLSHVRTHLIDRAVQPVLDTHVEMDLRFSDLASPVRPAKLSIELLSSNLLDSVTLEAEGTSDSSQLNAKFQFSARGLHPAPMKGYLTAFGIHGTADGLTVRANGSLHTSIVPGKTDECTGTLKLADMGITADGQPALTLRALTLDIGSVRPGAVNVTRLLLEDGTFAASRTPSGSLRVAGLEWSPDAVPEEAPGASPGSHSNVLAPSRDGVPGLAGSGAASIPTPLFVWSVDELALRKFHASFKDDRVKPATELQFQVDDVTVKGILADASKPNSTATISGHFGAPGVADAMAINGSCRPFAVKKTFEMSVKADGVRPDALRPYLALAGIESDLQAGAFSCKMTADLTLSPSSQSIVANALLADVKWADGNQLLALDTVKITGLGLAEGSVRVDAIEVSGPRASVRREASGALWAAGFRYLLPRDSIVKSSPAASAALRPPTSSTSVPAVHAATAAKPLPKLPKLDIGRFTWNNVQLDLSDDASVPATKVSINNAGIELTDIHADFDPSSKSTSQGKVRAWLYAPGLAGALTLDGTVKQEPAGMTADLKVKGEQLSGVLAAPYLKAMGIEPTLRDGSFAADLHVEVAQKGEERFHAAITARNVRYSDAGQEMFGIDEADISSVDYQPGLLEIGAITLKKPRGQIVREKDEAIRAMGIRLILKKAEPKKSAFGPVAAVSVAPAASVRVPVAPRPPRLEVASAGPVLPLAASGSASEVARPTPATSPGAAPPPPAVVTLKKLTVEGGAFGWTDDAVTPTAQTTARADGEITGVTWGRPGAPANLSFTIKADGVADEVKIKGTVNATVSTGGAKLEISASGLRQGMLGSYLPPGVTIEMKDGRFHGKLDASAAIEENSGPEDPAAAGAKGGVSANLALSDIELSDGPGGPPLLHLDAANIAISRLDLREGAGVIAIDEISATGAEAAARQSIDGTLHAAGIALGKPPEKVEEKAAPETTQPSIPKTAPTPAPAAPATVPATPATAPAMAPSAAAAPIDVRQAVQSAAPGSLVLEKKKHPLISVKNVDLNLRRFTFADESRIGSPPVVISNLRFHSRKPIEALGEDPSSHGPIDLGLTLRVENVIDEVNFSAQSSPFSSQPTLLFDLAATGIHGDGLIALVPELKKDVDGSNLTDGQFHLHGETQMKIDRLDPLDFTMKRGFVCDFFIKGLEFRGTKGGDVLAGVDEIRSEGVEVRPAKGIVLVRTLEVNKIVGQASLENDGVHALGLVYKMQLPGATPATQPATQPTTQPATLPSTTPSDAQTQPTAIVEAPTTKPATTQPVAQAATQPAPPSFEIRVARVVVSGIDFKVTDNTVKPPLLVPLNQLDLDVRDLSSLAMTQDRRVRFNLLVGAGKVPLPKRLEQNAAGAIKDMGALLSGKKVDTAVVIEQRDLFSQVQVDGVLGFYPKPNGWLKASVSSFDLAAMKSEVQRGGVDLANGVFDTTINARLPGDGSMLVASHFTVTDLELQEPANGPIVRYLRLPISLDAVLALLRDSDGSIDIPMDVPVKSGHLDTGQIGAAAALAFLEIVAKAMASSPLKVASAAADTFGALLGAEKTVKKEVPVVLTFAEGDAALLPGAQGQLAVLAKRLKDEPNIEVTVRSELGWGDVARAGLRANPSPDDCRELINRLSRRRGELLKLRAELTGRARGDLAARPSTEAAVTLNRLHGVERDLAATEDALDRMYDLLRPGAEKEDKKIRRTRQAALEVSQAREQSARAALLLSGLPGLEGRIHLTRPQFNNPAPGTAGGKVEIMATVKKNK